MYMDGTFIEVLERVLQDKLIVEEGGKKFSRLDMKPIFHEPRSEPFKVRTLSAVRDYLKDNRDALALKDLILHVVNHENVRLVSTIGGQDRRRDAYMAAEADVPEFGFGEWLDTEKFIISMNALFMPSTGRDALLQYVSRIKVEGEGEILDDGVSQAAKTRVGVKGGLTETQAAPSRVVLVPYRTFLEIEQPESEFVFRMRLSGGGVQLAIFEADGGAWRRIAMERIRDWIRSEVPGLAVIS